MFEIAIDEVKLEVPLYGGVIETSTPRAIYRIKSLESFGYKRFVVTPAFYRTLNTGDEFFRLFGNCRDTSNMDMTIYNIPSCTNSYIPLVAKKNA